MKNQKIKYQMDEWVFVPYEDKFILHGEDIIIDNRLSKLFHFLCDNPETVFSRDELINEVWNGSILTDQVITQAIFELRKILKQHGNHPYGYIVTVPKRGYKLDAKVQQIVEALSSTLEVISDESRTVIEDEELPSSAITDPTKALHNTSAAVSTAPIEHTTPITDPSPTSDEPSLTKDQDVSKSPSIQKVAKKTGDPVHRSAESKTADKTRFKKRWFVVPALIVLGISVAYSYMHVSSNQEKMKVAEAEVTQSYISLEPRYIHVVMDSNVLNDDLKVGFTKKLLEYLKTYKDFRLIYDGPAASVAANELRFNTHTKDGQDYLEIEYVNRISGHKHLDRNYRLTPSSLKPAMKKSLDDLLDSFNIEIDKALIANLVDELPESNVSTAAALTSLGASYHNYTHIKALNQINKAQEESPNNPYVVATNYIFQVSHMYLNPTQNTTEDMSQLNLSTLAKFDEFSSMGKVTPRILEAKAMMALSNDKPLEAKSLLQSIPHERRSIFFYVLNAKASELIGNRDAAEEFYYHAVLETSDIQILNLSEVLFFNSDLSDIKEKLRTNYSN
ncbi:winged helix-turn-helix domain-containing protein [Vibrio sp. E150_011]